MMRGYRCKQKTAVAILTTLGFRPAKSRGYILERTTDISPKKPCRLHAIIHIEANGTQYIDMHADYLVLVDGKYIHESKRDHRCRRFVALFSQIDHDRVCMAGHKLLRHYGDLRIALTKYPSRHQSKHKKYEA